MGVRETDAEPEQNVTKPRATRTSKKEIAKKQISMLLDVTNNIAAGVAGPQAVMRQYEREMIEYPLWAYAETHTAPVGKVADAAAPLVCVVGISLWLRRVLAANGTTFKLPQRPRKPAPNAPVIPPQESQRVTDARTAELIPDMPEPPNGRVVDVNDIRSMTQIGRN